MSTVRCGGIYSDFGRDRQAEQTKEVLHVDEHSLTQTQDAQQKFKKKLVYSKQRYGTTLPLQKAS